MVGWEGGREVACESTKQAAASGKGGREVTPLSENGVNRDEGWEISAWTILLERRRVMKIL